MCLCEICYKKFLVFSVKFSLSSFIPHSRMKYRTIKNLCRCVLLSICFLVRTWPACWWPCPCWASWPSPPHTGPSTSSQPSSTPPPSGTLAWGHHPWQPGTVKFKSTVSHDFQPHHPQEHRHKGASQGSRTVGQVLVDFAVCDWWIYCKALCDEKFSQIEENFQTFLNIL